MVKAVGTGVTPLSTSSGNKKGYHDIIKETEMHLMKYNIHILPFQYKTEIKRGKTIV